MPSQPATGLFFIYALNFFRLDMLKSPGLMHNPNYNLELSYCWLQHFRQGNQRMYLMKKNTTPPLTSALSLYIFLCYFFFLDWVHNTAIKQQFR